jgi:hypothetical protein
MDSKAALLWNVRPDMAMVAFRRRDSFPCLSIAIPSFLPITDQLEKSSAKAWNFFCRPEPIMAVRTGSGGGFARPVGELNSFPSSVIILFEESL